MAIQKRMLKSVFTFIITSVIFLSSCTLQRDGLKQRYTGLNKVPVQSSEIVISKENSINNQNIDVKDMAESVQQDAVFSHEDIDLHSSVVGQKPIEKVQNKRKISDEVPAFQQIVRKIQPDLKSARAAVSELKKNPSVDPITVIIWILIILLIAAILSIIGIPILELIVTILVIVLLVMLIMYLYNNL
jgi:hypothetical protein